MSDAHVAIAQLQDNSYFMVGGLALPRLPVAAGSAGLPEHSEGRGFLEVALGVVRRVCRERGLTLVLRGIARPEGFTTVLLLVDRSPERDVETNLAALVDECASRLQRWLATPLDRPALDRALELDPNWEAVRSAKPDAPLRVAPLDRAVGLLAGINTDTSAWYPLIDRSSFVLDMGVFPLELPNLETTVRRLAATSDVLAKHTDDRRSDLLENHSRCETVLAQRVFVGTALTLLCADAAPLLSAVKAHRHPRRGEVAGRTNWAVRPGECESEELSFAVLDYAAERGLLASLDPDPRQLFDLAGSLNFIRGARLPAETGAGGQTNPVDLSPASAEEQSRSSRPTHPDIFISYPHCHLPWVRDNIYLPLCSWRGENRIFFDRHSLYGGMSWFSELVRGATTCRVFLPVFCEEYFKSEFCMLELLKALERDPTARKGLFVAIQMHALKFPPECSLIQAEDAERADFRDRLLAILKSRLD